MQAASMREREKIRNERGPAKPSDNHGATRGQSHPGAFAGDWPDFFSDCRWRCAFLRPDEFFRGYLLAYMDWLGVTLGSMAILMIRHLTGGGWGTVIRRIMGAAMRCVPLMTILFVPILFGLPRLYVWARPLESIADKHLQEHLQDITKSYLSVNGFIIRAAIYFAIWNLLSFFLTKWSRATEPAADA